MSSCNEEPKARLAHIQRQHTELSSEAEPTLRPVADEEARRVRRSVSLSSADHASLTQWCHETAVQIGSARVTGQDVFRALVARLLTDETLACKIRADIADIFESS